MAEAVATATELSGRRCRPLLGTFVEIAAPAGHHAAIDAAFAAVAHIHARMSFHEEGSDLAALRRAPVGAAVEVDRETVAVLRIAAALHARSGGLFDVAVGAALVAAGRLPHPPAIAQPSLMLGTAADIELIDDTHVSCRAPLLIDLGGIAKGHAVDLAIETLGAAGVDHAVVNAGGDLRVLGNTPEPVWLREADGSTPMAIAVADAALASSSRPEQGSVHLGYGRVPLPAPQAVTVIADRCVIADAMTKAALADPELAAMMLNELGGAIVDRTALGLAA
jgi:thiamine biosynthesis lipoprotein